MGSDIRSHLDKAIALTYSESHYNIGDFYYRIIMALPESLGAIGMLQFAVKYVTCASTPRLVTGSLADAVTPFL